MVIETTSTARIGDQRAPVVGRGFEAELVGAPPRQPLLDLAQHDAPHDRRVVEHRMNARPGQRVAFAHVAGADQSDADRAHASPPRFMRADLGAARQYKYFILRHRLEYLFYSSPRVGQ